MELVDFDVKDIAQRLYLNYPQGWSEEPTWDDPPYTPTEDQASPNLKAVLMALAAGWKSSTISTTGTYDLLQYVKQQSRLTTATGFWLDYIARDFTNGALTRHPGETDDKFRRRLQIEILRPKVTRCALSCGVANLTGYKPAIVEPTNPGDCGGWGSVNDPTAGGPWGWGTAGAWGSMRTPFQLFVTATRPQGSGIPNVGGWSGSTWGWSTIGRLPWGYTGANRAPNFGNGEWCSLDQIGGDVTDADIYQTVAETMAAGTTAWTKIVDDVPPADHYGTGFLNVSFYLDYTCLAAVQPAPPVSFSSHIKMPIKPNIVFGIARMRGLARFTISASGSIAARTDMRSSVRLPFKSHSAILPLSELAISLPLKTTANFISVTYLGATSTPPFILGQSALTPPGGKVGRTFVLGASKIGAGQYGY